MSPPNIHLTRYLRREASVDHYEKRLPVALIILNCPILDGDVLRTLYHHASFTVCADGGANRLHDHIANTSSLPSTVAAYSLKPDAIHGDLDSLRPNVRDYYEKAGVEISEDPDQYSTDFGKSIKKTLEKVSDVEDVLVLGSIGGRIDQGLGLMGELYREQVVKRPTLRFWFVSESSISVLLPPGKSVVHTPLDDGLIVANAGILPLYGKAVVSLKGFEWDVTDWPTEMGGQVSTSNHIIAEYVEVTTDVWILFTVERVVGK